MWRCVVWWVVREGDDWCCWKWWCWCCGIVVWVFWDLWFLDRYRWRISFSRRRIVRRRIGCRFEMCWVWFLLSEIVFVCGIFWCLLSVCVDRWYFWWNGLLWVWNYLFVRRIVSLNVVCRKWIRVWLTFGRCWINFGFLFFCCDCWWFSWVLWIIILCLILWVDVWDVVWWVYSFL